MLSSVSDRGTPWHRRVEAARSGCRGCSARSRPRVKPPSPSELHSARPRGRDGPGAGVHVDAIGDHEHAVEADPELADERRDRASCRRPARARACSRNASVPEWAMVPRWWAGLLRGHADAVVLDHEHAPGWWSATMRISGSSSRPSSSCLDQGGEAGLVEGIRGVAHQLAEEDVAVGVQGVGHEAQHRGDLGLELVLLGGWGVDHCAGPPARGFEACPRAAPAVVGRAPSTRAPRAR